MMMTESIRQIQIRSYTEDIAFCDKAIWDLIVYVAAQVEFSQSKKGGAERF